MGSGSGEGWKKVWQVGLNWLTLVSGPALGVSIFLAGGQPGFSAMTVAAVWGFAVHGFALQPELLGLATDDNVEVRDDDE